MVIEHECERCKELEAEVERLRQQEKRWRGAFHASRQERDDDLAWVEDAVAREAWLGQIGEFGDFVDSIGAWVHDVVCLLEHGGDAQDVTNRLETLALVLVRKRATL